MTVNDVDDAHFRQLMGRFATGVVVITTLSPQGRPVGMTANSLASVSLHPPLLSVCVDREARMHEAILQAPAFAVNVLSAEQEAISRRFAAGDAYDRFEGMGYRLSRQGLVLLEGVVAHIECQRHAEVEAGDHTIVVGRVTSGSTTASRPLLYYRGGYATLQS